MNPYIMPDSKMMNFELINLSIFPFMIILLWSLTWKGFALWKAAKKNHVVWFIILLIINTVGILEILYFYIFSELSYKKEEKRRKRSKGKS